MKPGTQYSYCYWDVHLDQRQISGTWDVAPVPFIPYVH